MVNLQVDESTELDIKFVADAVAASEEYELTGVYVPLAELESVFIDSLSRAENYHVQF